MVSDPPAYVDEIEQALRERGRERRNSGEIGWTVWKDFMFRIKDEQGEKFTARTGDVYRSKDDGLHFEYIGASFYLTLDGDPLDITDDEYVVSFDIIEGRPWVQVDTDLRYWAADPIYHEIEDILDDHDLPVTYTEPVLPDGEDEACA